eukprot:TRINITY_DN3758_c0_g1_i1.p1 TRINITY_DN3758_c0_g1~~TRINITY_DN3758_c0_g1_i1.p1  ORF type:complete len:160 (+),score=34.96 TRINITY_DN3758_c0_g1_i1:161-640(+)
MPLHKRMETLLDNHIAKYACCGGKFQNAIFAPNIVAIFSAHRKNLKKIFKVYAGLSKKSESTGKKSKEMSLEMFISMLKDAAVLNEVKASSVQQVVRDYINIDDSGLVYEEFIECLGAFSVLKYPNPYMSLEDKVNSCIATDIVHSLINQGRMKNAIKR